jgi:hypothetical protein
VAEENSSEQADDEGVERIERSRRLLGGAVPVLGDAEEPDTVPTCPDIDEQTEIVG